MHSSILCYMYSSILVYWMLTRLYFVVLLFIAAAFALMTSRRKRGLASSMVSTALLRSPNPSRLSKIVANVGDVRARAVWALLRSLASLMHQSTNTHKQFR
jgi:lambda repressor-like predicted transcriptional regulator